MGIGTIQPGSGDGVVEGSFNEIGIPGGGGLPLGESAVCTAAGFELGEHVSVITY